MYNHCPPRKRAKQMTHLFLSLQTARSLLKALLAVRAGKRVAGNAAYLNDTQTESRSKCSVSSQRDWLDPAKQIAAFRCAFRDTEQVHHLT